jgi:hypothetical protein
MAAGPVRGEFTLVIPATKSARRQAEGDDEEPGQTS